MVLRLGIIGCGFISTEAHLPGIRASESVRVVAAADPAVAALERYGRAAGLPSSALFADHRELLADGDIDAVIISTPPATHCQITIEAARAGKHVLTEKPMATALSEAQTMIAEAAAAGVTLGVINNYLQFPETRLVTSTEVRELIGGVRLATIEAVGIGMDLAMIAKYTGMDWRRSVAPAGGGVMLDYGVHAAYLLEAYFDQPALSVSAVTGNLGIADSVEDFVSCTVEFETGFGHVLLSWEPSLETEARSLQSGRVSITGDAGAVDYLFCDAAEGPHSQVCGLKLRDASGTRTIAVEQADPDGLSALAASFRDTVEWFAVACDEQGRDYREAEVGLRSLAIALAAYESDRQGGRMVKLMPYPSSESRVETTGDEQPWEVA